MILAAWLAGAQEEQFAVAIDAVHGADSVPQVGSASNDKVVVVGESRVKDGFDKILQDELEEHGTRGELFPVINRSVKERVQFGPLEMDERPPKTLNDARD